VQFDFIPRIQPRVNVSPPALRKAGSVAIEHASPGVVAQAIRDAAGLSVRGATGVDRAIRRRDGRKRAPSRGDLSVQLP
jgi:hypothetical protein